MTGGKTGIEARGMQGHGGDRGGGERSVEGLAVFGKDETEKGK